MSSILVSQPFTSNSVLTLKSHIHQTILISARWSATSFSFLMGQASTSMQHTTSQSPSHYRWCILIDKQWYQLPEFIPSTSRIE